MSTVYIVSLAEDMKNIQAEISTPLIQKVLQENNLPPVLHVAAETFWGGQLLSLVIDPQRPDASFSPDPMPHLLIRKKLFFDSQERKQFVLLHEFRHIWQSLVDPDWNQYRRAALKVREQHCARLEPQEAYRFLSVPLEIDAQEYALQHLPDIGASIITNRAAYYTKLIREHTAPHAAALPVCLDLMPSLREWHHLLYNGVIPLKARDTLQNHWEQIHQFVSTRTVIREHPTLKLLYFGYIQERDNYKFLSNAEDFLIYLQML